MQGVGSREYGLRDRTSRLLGVLHHKNWQPFEKVPSILSRHARILNMQKNSILKKNHPFAFPPNPTSNLIPISKKNHPFSSPPSPTSNLILIPKEDLPIHFSDFDFDSDFKFITVCGMMTKPVAGNLTRPSPRHGHFTLALIKIL